MGKSNNADISEEEKKFFEDFESNINLSKKEDEISKYGFFHLTSMDNLNNIQEVGLLAQIGENSKNYETKSRIYYSIGALGTVGIINRAIYLNILKRGKSKEQAFENLKQILENSAYLKLNIRDVIEYASNDFMTRRNSHTIEGVNINPSEIEIVKSKNSNNALDVFKNYFAKNCNYSDIRLGKDGEENYIGEFLEYLSKNKNYYTRQASSTLKSLNVNNDFLER